MARDRFFSSKKIPYRRKRGGVDGRESSKKPRNLNPSMT